MNAAQQKEKLRRTAWFRKAEYGFFFHFLNPHRVTQEHPDQRAPYSQEEWNREVNSFNVARFAEQLHRLKAGYAFLTVGQNSGYYCAPNTTYDRILGLKDGESRCSNRDLISDFANGLEPYQIPLMAYTTALAPYFDRLAVQKFEAVPPWEHLSCNSYNEFRDLKCNDSRLRNFQRKWEAVHMEWMTRWRTRIKGWWVDGAFFGKQMYDFPDAPNGASFARSLRTCNPDALIAFNPGMICEPHPVLPSVEDFTAGEVNTPEFGILSGPLACGVQYHILSFIGSYWSRRPLRYTAKEMAEITRAVTGNGGVVTWDIPFTAENGIDPDAMELLEGFAAEYRNSKRCFPKTSVRITPPEITPEGLPVDGKAVITAESGRNYEAGWNGQYYEISGTPSGWCVPLSAVLPAADLRVTHDGFTCTYPVTTVREFCLSREPSEPFRVKTEEGILLAELTLAIKHNSLRIDGTVFESEVVEPEVTRRLCNSNLCSCMVLFLSSGTPHQTQLFLRPDGHIFHLLDAVVSPVRDVEYDCSAPENGHYLVHAKIPLPYLPELSGEKFYFNLAQNVNRDGKILTGMLFGGRNKNSAPIYDSARFCYDYRNQEKQSMHVESQNREKQRVMK